MVCTGNCPAPMIRLRTRSYLDPELRAHNQNYATTNDFSARGSRSAGFFTDVRPCPGGEVQRNPREQYLDCECDKWRAHRSGRALQYNGVPHSYRRLEPDRHERSSTILFPGGQYDSCRWLPRVEF